MFERCSRELEGRKQEKHVVIRDSRLMIDAFGIQKHFCNPMVQNPAYRRTIFLTTNNLKDANDLKDINYTINNEKTLSFCSTPKCYHPQCKTPY